MTFQITVRHGIRRVTYHTYTVEAPDLRAALVAAAEGMPEAIVADADLVELRRAPEPEERTYVPEGGQR